MRYIIGLVVAALITCVGVDGHARPRRHHRVKHAVHVVRKRANRANHHARRMATRQPRPAAVERDEVALSPMMMKQLQHNLADGGYLDGPIDGRMTPRTRHALASFQREYHLGGSGALTRASAEALLGRDSIGAFTIAGGP